MKFFDMALEQFHEIDPMERYMIYNTFMNSENDKLLNLVCKNLFKRYVDGEFSPLQRI